MNHYVTGSTIKALREKQRLTQSQLAEKLCVSDKTISKWETRRGFPDISLLKPLACRLQVSDPQNCLSGEQIVNTNRSANVFKITFVYLSDMRKYSTFYRTSYGFLLWNYPSTIGSRRRR